MGVTVASRLERLVRFVPGVAGYQDRENSRATDKQVRMRLVQELGRLMIALEEDKARLADGGDLSGLPLLDRLSGRIERLSRTVEFAGRGYTGLFDLHKVDGDTLDQLYAFDLGLFDALSAVRAKAEAVRAVLGQQVSVAAARTLAARLVSRVGRPIAGGTDGLTHLFPAAAALADADLDGLGLTGARVGALRALACAVTEGRVDFGAPVEEVTAALAALPGFGAWTAQYVALRALGEPDAFPAADLVLRRVAAAGGAPLTARALEARAEAWRPWRSYAVLHLWRAAGDAVRRENS